MPQLGRPAPSLQFVSSAGDPQPVCELTAVSSPRLLEPCCGGFPALSGTLAMWVSTTSVTGGETLFRYTSPSRSRVGALTVSSAANIEVRMGTAGTGPTGVAINDGGWHRLAVTYAAGGQAGHYTVCVYVDENLLFMSSAGLATTARPMPGGDLTIGGGLASPADLTGRLSEVQVWDRALTASEVATGLFRRAAPEAAGLVLNWPLNVPPPHNPAAVITGSSLRFRTGALSAAWDPVAGDPEGYQVRLCTVDGLWSRNDLGFTDPGNTYIVTDHPLSTRFGAAVAAFAGGLQGPWSPTVTITAFELSPPSVTLAWDATAERLTAGWGDVAQRQTFTLELYQDADAAPQTILPGRTALAYDATGLLDSDSAWRLDVRAAALGSLGPAQPRQASPQAVLEAGYRMADKILNCRWPARPDAEGFRLRVAPAPGGMTTQAPYIETLSPASTGRSLADTAYPLAAGTLYTVELRVFGHGTIGPWTRVRLTPHTVPAPVLDWRYGSAADILDAVWAEVSPGSVYDVDLYKDATLVVHETGQTARVRPMTTLLADPEGYRLAVSAVEGGITGPANTPLAPAAAAPVSRHLVASHTIEVTWSARQPDAYLRLFKDGATTAFAAQRSTAGVVALPAPPVDFPDGTVVECGVRGLTPGCLGPIESTSLTIRQLAAPAPAIGYTAPATMGGSPVLTMSWPAINPPLTVAYEHRTTTNGSAGPAVTVTGLSEVVTGLLRTDGTISVAVRGTAERNVGPWSTETTAVTPGAPTAVHDRVTGMLRASWTGDAATEHYYVEMVLAGENVPEYRTWLDGTVNHAEIPASGGADGKQATVRVRAVRGAALSPFAEAVTTLPPLPAPIPDPLTYARAPAKQITVAWRYDSAPGATLLGFLAELDAQESGDSQTRDVTDPGGRSAVFSDSTAHPLTTGRTYSARVRARVRTVSGSTELGPWSGPATIAFGVGRLGLRAFSVTSNDAGDLTLGWTMEEPVESATFEARVRSRTPGLEFGRSGIAGTAVILPAAETHVVNGTAYTVEVRVVVPYGGAEPAYGPWASREVTAGQAERPPVPGTPERGDPVNLATGALGYANRDLVVPGVVPLVFEVAYRGDLALPGDEPSLPATPMGARWNHCYNTRVVRAPDGTAVTVSWGGEGLSTVVFDVPAGTTGDHPQRGVPTGSTLQVDASLNYRLTTREQSVYGFDPGGALRTITDPPGNTTELTYRNGRLERVTEPSGHWLELSYHPGGRVASVTADTGAAVFYAHDTAGNLTAVTDPLGGTRHFTYDGRSRMTTATDTTGAIILENTYTDGRVTFQRDGRAIAAGEPWGTTFAYALSGDTRTITTTVTDRLGQVSVHTLGAATHLPSEEVVQLGNDRVRRTRYTHDGNGRMVTRSVFEGPAASSERGNLWRYAYDGRGNRTSVTDPLGGVERSVFDELNRLRGRTDRLGNTTVYEYDGMLPRRVVVPTGQVATVTYRPGTFKGLPQTITDIYGAVSTLTYDEHGRIATVSDPGGITQLGYDRWGWPRTVARRAVAGEGDAGISAARTEIRECDAMGRLVGRRVRFANQPESAAFVTACAYDGEGRITSVTDPFGHVTRYLYDQAGLPRSIVRPSGDAITLGHDREERLVSADLGAGVVERGTLDPLGRVVTETDPGGHLTLHAYAMATRASAPPGTTPFDLTETVTLPEPGPSGAGPLTRRTTLDALDREVSRVDTAGGETTTRYESIPLAGSPPTWGLRVTTALPVADGTQAAPFTRSVTTDALGRVVEQVNERGMSTRYAYGPASTVPGHGSAVLAVTVTGSGGGTHLRLFDGLGRLVEVRRGQGASARSTTLAYDPLDRAIGVAKAGGDRTASTTTSAYSYADGLVGLVVDTDRAGGPAFRFDAAGRLREVTGPAGQNETYTYTPNGQIASFRNGRGQVVTYGYDTAGRLIDITVPGGPSIHHILDPNGNRAETRVGDVAEIVRTFDTLGRLSGRTSGGQRTGYTYAALGGIDTLTYPSPAGEQPVTVRHTYDALGRLRKVTDWAGRVTTYGYHPTGEPADVTAPGGVRTTTGLDDEGRLRELSTWLGTALLARATYGYNAFGEVTEVREILTARPDPVKDRSMVYEQGRLTGVDGVVPGYDGDGNMSQIPEVKGTATYDVFNALIDLGSRKATYDADGLRVRVQRDQSATIYRYDVGGYAHPWREQADPVRAVSAVPASWTAGCDRLLVAETPAARDRYVHGVGLIGAEDAAGRFTTYVFDGQGSTIGLVRDGVLVARHAYDLFGTRTGGDPLDQPYGYAGRSGVVTDTPELLHMRARVYAAHLARFTGHDHLFGPPVDGRRTNRYIYTRNDPLLHADPLGLDFLSLWGPLFGGIGALFVFGAGLAIFGPEIAAALGLAAPALAAPALAAPAVAAPALAAPAALGSAEGQGLGSVVRQVTSQLLRRSAARIPDVIEMQELL
ncbi:LamG-like jellyroll fold domain-containing protein [Nonomuraea insulae]|uniref:LamG-like jellyroll fold domain-containing protein n=1 Tax=Nonomuraea insulae TaxID=1616787 RepID=A0ABW1CRM7_9ACTN